MAEILLADDDLFYRTLIGEALRSRTHAVTIVSQGHLAGRALRARRYDLAILDVHMDGACGIGVLEEAVREGATAMRPLPAFLLVSGDGGGEAERRSREAGSNAFLLKPFRAGELEEAVAALLEGRRRAWRARGDKD